MNSHSDSAMSGLSELKVAPGTLLAAGPDMLDANFMHAVVLICQHSDEGAVGFVVNRRIPYTTQQAFPDHPLLGEVDLPIYQGGPVQLDSLQFLHRVPDELPQSIPVTEDLYWGGNALALAAFLKRNGAAAVQSLRLLIGYSGWGAGQLEAELAAGVWLPAPGSAQVIFDSDLETLWRRVLRSLGPAAEGFSDQPPDPSWN